MSSLQRGYAAQNMSGQVGVIRRVTSPLTGLGSKGSALCQASAIWTGIFPKLFESRLAHNSRVSGGQSKPAPQIRLSCRRKAVDDLTNQLRITAVHKPKRTAQAL